MHTVIFPKHLVTHQKCDMTHLCVTLTHAQVWHDSGVHIAKDHQRVSKMWHESTPCLFSASTQCVFSAMGWIWLVGSLKLQVFFAKEPCKTDYILQKRPMILRSLLIVATTDQLSVYFLRPLLSQSLAHYYCVSKISRVEQSNTIVWERRKQ